MFAKTQCGADAAELECNDDSGFDVALRPQSAIQFLAELGTRYFIFVDGYDADDFGDLALALTEGPCEGEPCDADRRINLGDTLIGELVGESVHRGSCAGGGPELIYEFSTNQAGAVCVSTASR